VNYLGLVNRSREKCGISGDALTALSGAAGESLRVVNWVNEVWLELQTARPDWDWMRNDFSVATVAGRATYTPAQCGITDWGNWALDNFRNYVTSVGNTSEIEMEVWNWESWRDTYNFGANRSVTTRPIVCAIAPDRQLCLGPIGAAGYTVTGSYFKVASELAADADIPGMPVQFHIGIVYGVMMRYGEYESAPEVYTAGENGWKKIMARLHQTQLPALGFGASLA
jgi:hypothetical protein